MTAVNGHFGPFQNRSRITLIPSVFPPRQNNTSCSPDNVVDTILYTGNADTFLYREDNVDISIYQETYCPGNVDKNLLSRQCGYIPI